MPWFFLIVGNKGASYDGRRDNGLVFAVVVLIVLSVLFVILVVVNKFVLKKWMAAIFLASYVVYVLYGITFEFWLRL